MEQKAGQEKTLEGWMQFPESDVCFRTIGSSHQTFVLMLAPTSFDEQTEMEMVEPGRTLVIGDIRENLKEILTKWGRPALQDITAHPGRENGVFSGRAYTALRRWAFQDEDKIPRAHSN